MAFIIGLPCLQIILFCWAIGHDPTGLKLAVANYELNNGSMAVTQDCPATTGCNNTLLSCRYLKTLELKNMVIVSVIILILILKNYFIEKTNCLQEYYASDKEAFYEVERGRAWGALVFSHNYSESLVDRTEAGRDAESWNLESSDVTVKLDMSSKRNIYIF